MTSESQAAPPAPPSARLVGLAVVGIFLALGVVRASWVGQHGNGVRPVGSGDAAPSISLPLLGGGQFTLAAGQVTVVDFWATWCGPCRAELPHVEALYQKYKGKGVQFVAVNAEGLEAKAGAERIARALHLTLPIALDGDETSVRYKVSVLPTLAVVGKNGAIAQLLVGVHDDSEIASAIDHALGE